MYFPALQSGVATLFKVNLIISPCFYAADIAKQDFEALSLIIVFVRVFVRGFVAVLQRM